MEDCEIISYTWHACEIKKTKTNKKTCTDDLGYFDMHCTV